MIKINDKIKCTGCTACASVCPRRCITMAEDKEGFLYPSVDLNLCTNCHLCENICPINSNKDYGARVDLKKVYALINNDVVVRKNSASGGAFALFAAQVLSQGGIVYGAAFSHDFTEVHHVRITTIDELPSLQGSKYVQSKLENIFFQVQQDLLAGRRVLFSGTSCQNAGLRKYLGKDYKYLLCIEFICHGVPSPKVWRKYLEMIKKKLGGSIVKVLFREKSVGGGELIMFIESDNHKFYRAPDHMDPFYNMFMKNISLRPSCYSCAFKTDERTADITIADFWRGELILPGFGREGDMSLVFLNTSKAYAFFEGIRWNAKISEVEMSDAIIGNSSYYCSVQCPDTREGMFEDLDKMKFEKLCRKYARPTRRQTIAYKLEKSGLLKVINHIFRRKY